MSQQLFEFTKLGFQIHGIVHVGMNEGQEIPVYLQNRWGPVLGFEPLPHVCAKLMQDFESPILLEQVRIISCALGSFYGNLRLLIPFDTSGQEDTPRTSAYKEGWRSLEKPDGSPLAGYLETIVPMLRFDDITSISNSYDALVIDVQGMELEVLKGAEKSLQKFKYLVVECSEIPIYEGEPSAQEVVSWLVQRGFVQITPILPHDDIMFLRADLAGE